MMDDKNNNHGFIDEINHPNEVDKVPLLDIDKGGISRSAYAVGGAKFANFSSTFRELSKFNLGEVHDLSPYFTDSIAFVAPRDKSLCRVANILFQAVEDSKKVVSFSAINLFEIIDYVDLCTSRDYLYESRTLEECNFLIQEPIDLDAPLEKLLAPIKQFKLNLNSAYFTNPWLMPALMIYLVTFTHQRMRWKPWEKDISCLLDKVSLCSPSYLESVYYESVRELCGTGNLFEITGGESE